MRAPLRNSLITSSFLAAAGFAGWQGWHAWEDHLAEIRKGSVPPVSFSSTNGWFTEKVPGENQATETNPWIVAALPHRENEKIIDPDEAFSLRQQLITCQLTQAARDDFWQYMQEPVDGVKKYELLYKAAGYNLRMERSGALRMTEDEMRALLAVQARAALNEWQREIQSRPDDPAGNIKRYEKMTIAFWYASNKSWGSDNREIEAITGINLWSLHDAPKHLTEAAREQNLQEFRNFPPHLLQSGSEYIKRYLDLYAELRSLNPYYQDHVFVNGSGPVSETAKFAEELMRVTGMTIEQARNLFRQAETLDSTKQNYDARLEQERHEREKSKDEATKLSETRESLRQCQYQLR